MNRSELPNELEQAARCVDDQANALDLATFAHDVLATWADSHSLSPGPRTMTERAVIYGVSLDNAATELGNLLAMLERGPRGNAELSLVAAFAMRGFDRLYEAAHGGEQQASADRFVTHLDWLELATDYRLTPFIERLLGVSARRALIQALSRAIGREDLPVSVLPDVGARGRNAARLTVLAGLRDDTAIDALRSIRRQARDPATRVLALALGPEGSDRE
ncbi:MAG TPA: hypothetical protein VHZ95_00390, partial [Polyangiales bacterium]|nr:hypothetical protein [Polyangiales bacterium]